MNVITNICLIYVKIDNNNNFRSFCFFSNTDFSEGILNPGLLFVCINASVPNFPHE